jgi:hypothetical protein
MIENAQHMSRRTLRTEVRKQSEERARMRRNARAPLPQTYENKVFGIRVGYPKDWMKQEYMQKEGELTLVTMFLSPDATNEVQQNINLVVENLTDPSITLQKYTQLGIEKEQLLFEGYKLIESQPVTVGGQMGYKVIFVSTFDGTEMKFEQVWYLKDDTAHVWTFADLSSVFDQHIIHFDQMMDSLVVE